MATTADPRDTPKIFRITIEPSSLDKAAAFYAKLLAQEGKRHPGPRHYFDCGGVILAVIDTTAGGLPPHPGPKSIYFVFAVKDLDAVHARAKALGALSRFKVHGEPASEAMKPRGASVPSM